MPSALGSGLAEVACLFSHIDFWQWLGTSGTCRPARCLYGEQSSWCIQVLFCSILLPQTPQEPPWGVGISMQAAGHQLPIPPPRSISHKSSKPFDSVSVNPPHTNSQSCLLQAQHPHFSFWCAGLQPGDKAMQTPRSYSALLPAT